MKCPVCGYDGSGPPYTPCGCYERTKGDIYELTKREIKTLISTLQSEKLEIMIEIVRTIRLLKDELIERKELDKLMDELDAE